MQISSPPPSQANIFLYGPSGSGKSTTGRVLAANLNQAFLDADELIETQSGMTIPEIFAREGETGFREREKQALQRALAAGGKVVALGGGALTTPENRTWVQAAGEVVLLNAPLETLLSRLQKDSLERPLLTRSPGTGSSSRDHLRDLLARRGKHYASFPVRVETEGKSPAQVAWAIQRSLGRFHLRGMASRKHPGYDVRVQPGGLDRLGLGLQAGGMKGPVAVVSDENVAGFYLSRVIASLIEAGYPAKGITIPAGEAHKTLETLSALWEAFLGAKIERGSTVVALGGGVVGDLAGFAAATHLRGVPWVVVPTSLLAMVDSSLGGKTGADLPQGKNLIGAFHPPRLVLADPQVLATLPQVEFANGMAEVIKHGIIADPELYANCRRQLGVPNPAGRHELVARGMAVKVKIIEEDPFEKGMRAALNYGHTLGHGVELASGFQLRHGECVAIGMVGEARLAEQVGLAEKGLGEEIASALRSLGLPVEIPAGLDRETVIRAMKRDKKVAGGVIQFALPAAIGDVRVGIEVAGWEKIVQEMVGR